MRRARHGVSSASRDSRMLAGNLTAPGGSPETEQCALAMTAPRLVQLREKLKPTGILYRRPIVS